MSTKIEYKGIVEERLSDAPFVGALIMAPTCSHNCPGCFNQWVKSEPTKRNTAFEIIAMVQKNKFHEGIILAGLEWTESPQALMELVFAALGAKMKVMVYTHMTQKEFTNSFPILSGLAIWCKFGSFVQGAKGTKSHGIDLASDNQHVVWMPDANKSL